MSTQAPRSVLQRILFIAGIVLIAVNLRPALAGVGPLISDIRQDTGLSNTVLGLLTTLPLLAFGVVSALTPLVTRRLGIEGTLAAALFLLAAGILLRTVPSVTLLFVGTALLGVAIAFGNVLLPSLVKRDFSERTGVMTSVYSSAMGIGAALAAGISVPMAERFGLGWRGSLGVWALPAVLALALWLPQLKNRTLPRYTNTLGKSLKDLGRSGLAWHVAFFMGLQSLTFYVVLAWLPDILQSRGLASDYAGWMLALSQGAGIFGTVIIPTWAEHLDDQRPIVWTLTLLEGASLLGLLSPSTALAPLWMSVIGFTLGGAFGLALLFIVLRTTSTETATELSGMAQSIGYLLAATGPTLFGFFHDLTHTWSTPLFFLMVIALAKLYAGLAAGRPQAISK